MARRKTKYPNIYFNEETKKYDVKFNYKEYDPKLQKNVYKAKWKYNCVSVSEAKDELKRLQDRDRPKADEDITLAGILEVYEVSAKAQQLSITTVNTTKNQMKRIYHFLPSDTKLKNMDIDTYNRLVIAFREAGIADSTIRTYTATLKKLFRIAYQREYITANFFDKIPVNYLKKPNKEIDGISSRVITQEEFFLLDNYMKNHSAIYDGIDTYKTYRLLFQLLYYSGLRIGEALALTPGDFQLQAYKNNQRMRYAATDEADNIIFQVEVNKTLIRSDGGSVVREETKNHKDRAIPLPPKFQKLYYDYMLYINNETSKGLEMEDRLFPVVYDTVRSRFDELCRKAGIKKHKIHDFRHTYISNLIALGLPVSDVATFSGDTEQMILNTYIHSTENYKINLVEKLQKL